MLTPKNISVNCVFNILGFILMLNISGNQCSIPAMIAKIAPMDRT